MDFVLASLESTAPKIHTEIPPESSIVLFLGEASSANLHEFGELV